MKRRTIRFALAFGLPVLVASLGQVAQAGYVSSSLSSIHNDLPTFDLNSGAGAATAGESSPSKNGLPMRADSLAKRAVLVSFGHLGPTSGATPPAPDWTSSSQPVIAATTAAGQSPDRADWLGAEGRASLPPPLSTGIFRPPRFAG